ncbi:unnamed protein product [Bemisia tabaci]|uniref:Uncharacterized protein n=1 Tax=Bemisia tabaci TaxID=7038 RepID=A0A9P0F5A9_BEMTA|nr:unnamed protein product [Bemisia tabaci]
MQSNSAALLASIISVSMFAFLVDAMEDFEPKPTKKPTKLFKTDQFHKKNPFSFMEPSEEDLENPFVPPPMPKEGEDPSPWSWFLNPSSKGFVPPGEVSPPKTSIPPGEEDKKESKDAEADATRAQRFIGPSAIDPFFYSNPLTPLSPPRRPSNFGYGFQQYPYELFMVVQPRTCSNGTEPNGTAPPQDVGLKFLSNSDAPGPARCALAIASCCAPFNYHVRYPCFEMLGCYGAFWDMNPCSEDVVATAVQELAAFYKGPENATTTTAAPASTEATTPAAAAAAPA